MKILIVGGGGREHTLIRKLRENSRVTEIYCAPGNGGISRDAKCVPLAATDIDGIVSFAKAEQIHLVFVAPDDPLAAGMVDALEAAGIAAFGPRANAAIIESSKVFAKELMKKYRIPTADYAVFEDYHTALAYMQAAGKYPVVVKADGLALGKGVLICGDEAEAREALTSILQDRVFGAAGNQVVIEEYLTGPEVSVLAFTDGHTIKPMVASKDHKRALDHDEGKNTGGMGAISPNPHYTDAIAKECMETIFLPTIRAMKKEGRPFKGCLYFGLMLTKDGPKVIEYNARFGDPEAQVILPRLQTDLLEILEAVIEERLSEIEIRWSSEACACIVVASGGYPGTYQKGLPIAGLRPDGQISDEVTVYHAGTAWKDGAFVTSGGRVLGVTACDKDLEHALAKAYRAVERIHFEGAHYRRDIGKT